MWTNDLDIVKWLVQPRYSQVISLIEKPNKIDVDSITLEYSHHIVQHLLVHMLTKVHNFISYLVVVDVKSNIRGKWDEWSFYKSFTSEVNEMSDLFIRVGQSFSLCSSY